MKLISRTEELLLLVVCRLQADAYGLNIRDEVEAVSGKRFSVGGVYVPLDRLVRKGMLKTEKGAATAERMGRPPQAVRHHQPGLGDAARGTGYA
ncbi:MAG: helix-turn-helix transcriptional regulator [Bacteroidota bacterium]